MSYEIDNEFGKAYKSNKETTFSLEKAEKFLSDSIDNETLYFDKGYHRFAGWVFIPNGYSRFLVKYTYDCFNLPFEYKVVFAKTIESANIQMDNYLNMGNDDDYQFSIIPEPNAFKNIFTAPEDVKNRFTTIDFNFEDHHTDMNKWLHHHNVECLVDEEKGGIIAYYHKDHQAIILDKMNA